VSATPAPRPSADSGAEAVLTVHVLALPVGLQRRAQQHNEGLTRELVLIAEQMRQQGHEGTLPLRLVALVEQLDHQYGGLTDAQEQQLEAAYKSGAQTVDLTYRVPGSAAAAAGALGQILDEADDFCREGRHLLTMATPPELVAYRGWFLSQFVDQAAGHQPVPWSEWASATS